MKPRDIATKETEFELMVNWLRKTEIEFGLPKTSNHFPLKADLTGLVVFDSVLEDRGDPDLVSALAPMFKLSRSRIEGWGPL